MRLYDSEGLVLALDPLPDPNADYYTDPEGLRLLDIPIRGAVAAHVVHCLGLRRAETDRGHRRVCAEIPSVPWSTGDLPDLTPERVDALSRAASAVVGLPPGAGWNGEVDAIVTAARAICDFPDMSTVLGPNLW